MSTHVVMNIKNASVPKRRTGSWCSTSLVCFIKRSRIGTSMEKLISSSSLSGDFTSYSISIGSFSSTLIGSFLSLWDGTILRTLGSNCYNSLSPLTNPSLHLRPTAHLYGSVRGHTVFFCNLISYPRPVLPLCFLNYPAIGGRSYLQHWELTRINAIQYSDYPVLRRYTCVVGLS